MKAVWERVLMNRRAGGWVLLIAGIVGILHLFSEPFSRWTMAQFSRELPHQRGWSFPFSCSLLVFSC